MKRHRMRPLSVAAVIGTLVVGGSLLLVAGCSQPAEETPAVQIGEVKETPTTGEGVIGPADDWVVIHGHWVADLSADPPTCTRAEGDAFASLPACLKVREGERIGFINLYRDAEAGQTVKVGLPEGVFDVGELQLGYEQWKILVVARKPEAPAALDFALVDGAPRAGPIMIPVDDQ